MKLSLQNIFESVILEGAQRSDIIDAIQNKYRVNIYYGGDDEQGKGKRTIEVYGFGMNKFGTPIIRAYQVFGDTKTEKPAWKTFNINKIIRWEKTNWKFTKPVSDRDPSIPKFKPDGDKDMVTTYARAKF